LRKISIVLSVFDSLKLKISNYFLYRKLKRFTRIRDFKNLHQSNSVFVIGSNLEDIEGDDIRRLVQYLKQLNKEVFSLFYIENENDNINIQIPEIKLFNLSNLNNLFIPKDADILLLIDREFDLLIDLSLKESFALKYIFALSKARLKVGAAMNYKKKFGDLTIEIENNPSISYLITQIKHYLTQINRDQNVA